MSEMPEMGAHEAECPLCERPINIWFEGFWFEDRRTLKLGIDSNCTECPFTYHGHLPVEKDGGFVALLSEADDE